MQVSTLHTRRGRPRTDTVPEQVWSVQGSVSVQEAALAAEAGRRARFMVATNVPASRKSAAAVAAALQRAQRR